MKPALGLAFLSGYVALSYEILWYRALSFASGGAADTFALLLGAYLVGLAAGSLVSRRECRGSSDADRALQLVALFRLTLLANVFGFLVVPALAWLMTSGLSWKLSLPVVGVAAAGLGTVFPLVTHCWIAPDEKVGPRVSYVYLANILGSTAGSLMTGFVLMDHLSLAATHVLLGLLGLVMAATPLLLSRGRLRARGLITAAILAAVCACCGTALFDRIYEKLQLKDGYNSSRRFRHVVETKSGVITVNEIDQIFGGGIYDGAYNTGLQGDKNTIIRCYALAELHPVLDDVLMIGLSSGSWATVVANNPAVKRLTVIEINPGYLQLIPKYPEVAGLLSNPKVRIEIDDGRRWLVRNKNLRFDAIVANSTFHWRSNATNLLSKEFLELIRSRLKPGGMYYYNTTDSVRVAGTGCSVFPQALMVGNFLAVSDAPIEIDYNRLREKLFDYPRGDRTVFDRNNPEDVAKLDKTMAHLRRLVARKEDFLARAPAGIRVITDDNMGTEWGEDR